LSPFRTESLETSGHLVAGSTQGLQTGSPSGSERSADAQANPRSDGFAETRPVLSVQLKLFSGIGGAGLLSLPGIPSVRVLRGQGRFQLDAWQTRSHFQRAFAAYNSAALRQNPATSDLIAGPIAAFRNINDGWTP
jgi:hypothetical protein